jgi:hypothetical protein
MFFPTQQSGRPYFHIDTDVEDSFHGFYLQVEPGAPPQSSTDAKPGGQITAADDECGGADGKFILPPD